MADQPKKKPANAVTRNDSRKNGKAFKTKSDAYFARGKAYRGSRTRKSPQNAVQKVLLGGGALRNIAPTFVDPKNAFRLSGIPSNPPFDAAQVEVNTRLYTHLFTGN